METSLDLKSSRPADEPVPEVSAGVSPEDATPSRRNIDQPVVVVVGGGSYHSMVARHLREALRGHDVVVLNDIHISEPPGRRLSDAAAKLLKEPFAIRASDLDRHVPSLAEARPRNNPWYRQHAGRRSWD